MFQRSECEFGNLRHACQKAVAFEISVQILVPFQIKFQRSISYQPFILLPSRAEQCNEKKIMLVVTATPFGGSTSLS